MKTRRVKLTPIIVIIGDGEVWGRYRQTEHAEQAVRALRCAGIAASIECGGIWALARRLRAIEDILL